MPIAQDTSCPVFISTFLMENDDNQYELDEPSDEPFNAAEGIYDLYLEINNPDGSCGDSLVKAFCEIYQHGRGEDVIMYETSFEDNFDIYNNWIQIDADCGIVGGHYDSFAWSDARASDGDHSFKTTMYDIYKGNQDDYLECTKGFDVCEQNAVNITFDVWVEGDYDYQFGYYWPYDYLDFEIYSHYYDEWINPDVGPVLIDLLYYPALYILAGSYYFFDTTIDLYAPDPENNFLAMCRYSGDGWWNVWCELTRFDLISYGINCSDFRFRFSWHTDPEYQFEGAYIDNLKVISSEDVKTKVFQTHFKNPQIVEPGSAWFKFPLSWDATSYDNKKVGYEILLWLQTVDEDHKSLNDWSNFFVEGIFINVGDWFDVELVDYDPPNEDYIWIETSVGADLVIDPADAGHQEMGVMEQGDDAHIMAQIHLGGTVPAENIPVTATVYKKYWDILYKDSFESMSWSDSGSFDGPNLWHRTNTDAYTGDYSMGCFNKDTNHYENNMLYNYMLGPTMKMIDCEDMILEYYVKYLTEYSDDYWIIALYDPATNSMLGQSANSFPEGGVACPNYQGYGYSPEWKGPAEPRSAYCSMSLKDAYDYWFDIRGMFRDGDGKQSKAFQPGFTFYQSDSDGYLNAQAESEGIYWSGLYIDDVTIKALRVRDKVWEQTVIVPGPLEPCDTADVQFEWEDVPFCNYLITVTSHPEGACGNLGNYEASVQILSVTDLEQASPKEVDSIDLSGAGGGEWGISSSDYEYYLASNADSLTYDTDMNAVAQLCIDGEECVDISHLTYTPPTPFNIFPVEDFELGSIPLGWTVADWTAGAVWAPQLYGLGGWEEPSTGSGSYYCDIDDDAMGSGITTQCSLLTPVFDISNSALPVSIEFDMNFKNIFSEFGKVWLHDDVDGSAGGPYSTLLAQYTVDTDYHEVLSVDPLALADPTDVQIEFYYYDAFSWAYGWGIDNVEVIGYTAGSGITSLTMTFDAWWDLEDMYDFAYLEINPNCPCEFECDWQNVDLGLQSVFGYLYDEFNWYSKYFIGADDDGWANGITVDLLPYITSDSFCLRFRMESDDSTCFRGIKIRNIVIEDILYDDDLVDPHAYDFVDTFENLDNWCLDTIHYGQYWEFVDPDWCTIFPAVPVNDALVWTTEIADAYEAHLTFTHEYDFESYSGYDSVGYVELSADGGETWHVLGIYEGSSGGPVQECFKLTYWIGNDILVRFRAVGDGYYDCGYDGGYWCVWDLLISGKEDTSAPNTEIILTGPPVDCDWFPTVVKPTIVAADVGAGMGWIHYILDDQETVVEGDVVTFTISENGEHNLEFWGVDKAGNEEIPHNTVMTFRIDAGSPPSVQIIAPEPGLYLFGNKVFSLTKVFIIGGFTVEAIAEDDESGVYKVMFELDGDVIAEDTTAPYTAHFAEKHMGAGTLKVVAVDFAMNTARDTLDIVYYKFI